MDDRLINHNIPKSAEGTYYTIPFTVPDGLERITVSYRYKRLSGLSGRLSDSVSVVDLGLMDGSGRFLGWSGSSKSSIFVGPHSSTNGYLMTEIKPGVWSIIVGAYNIPDRGLDVEYEIVYTPKRARFYSGDLHMHSDASDGQHDVSSLARKASKTGLDFIAVTNHNNYSENLALPIVPGVTLLPAVEWTHYLGHMNFYGIEAPFDNSFIANSLEEMLTLVNKAKEKGALVSVCHPKCNLCPWLWKDDECFDLVEVWNGPMRNANKNAIAFWHELLMGGRKLPIVGGSDFHRDRSLVRFAQPVTRVYAHSPSKEDLLDAIANGHSYITASNRGAELELRYGDAMMGDSARREDGLDLQLQAARLRPGFRVKLVTSEGIAGEWRRFPSGRLIAEVPVKPEWRFAYLVAYRRIFGWNHIRAITNPIYFKV